jgi:site-specific recombinase XerD
MASSFSYHITKYFSEYLPLHIGASANTCKSYRDTFVQFLSYLESVRRVSAEKIVLETLTAEAVEGFLLHLEETREVSVSTRNQRLAAIHSFIKYLQKKELSCFGQCSDILSVPFKKNPAPAMAWLSIHEMETLFSVPDANSRKGLRHLAMLTVLYETGARVQELIDLTVAHLHLYPDSPSVDLRGKGNRLRHVPIREDVANILSKYLHVYAVVDNCTPVFTNNRGQRLTRTGVQYILNKHIEMARLSHPGMFRQKYSNHSFRHSKSMHLLEAGVNLVYIRDFLGHSSVTTTEIYAKTNPDIKRKIIVENSLTEIVSDNYDEEKRDDLLDWLKNNL